MAVYSPEYSNSRSPGRQISRGLVGEVSGRVSLFAKQNAG